MATRLQPDPADVPPQRWRGGSVADQPVFASYLSPTGSSANGSERGAFMSAVAFMHRGPGAELEARSALERKLQYQRELDEQVRLKAERKAREKAEAEERERRAWQASMSPRVGSDSGVWSQRGSLQSLGPGKAVSSSAQQQQQRGADPIRELRQPSHLISPNGAELYRRPFEDVNGRLGIFQPNSGQEVHHRANPSLSIRVPGDMDPGGAGRWGAEGVPGLLQGPAFSALSPTVAPSAAFGNPMLTPTLGSMSWGGGGRRWGGGSFMASLKELQGGPSEEQQQQAAVRREQLKRDLDEQIQLKRMERERVRAEQEAREVKELERIRVGSVAGPRGSRRGGGGEPIVDATGMPVADLRMARAQATFNRDAEQPSFSTREVAPASDTWQSPVPGLPGGRLGTSSIRWREDGQGGAGAEVRRGSRFALDKDGQQNLTGQTNATNGGGAKNEELLALLQELHADQQRLREQVAQQQSTITHLRSEADKNQHHHHHQNPRQHHSHHPRHHGQRGVVEEDGEEPLSPRGQPRPMDTSAAAALSRPTLATDNGSGSGNREWSPTDALDAFLQSSHMLPLGSNQIPDDDDELDHEPSSLVLPQKHRKEAAVAPRGGRERKDHVVPQPERTRHKPEQSDGVSPAILVSSSFRNNNNNTGGLSSRAPQRTTTTVKGPSTKLLSQPRHGQASSSVLLRKGGGGRATHSPPTAKALPASILKRTSGGGRKA